MSMKWTTFTAFPSPCSRASLAWRSRRNPENKKPRGGRGLGWQNAVVFLFPTTRIPHNNMKMTAAHWSAILEFHRTHNLTETAKRFALTAAGLIYWKRKFGIVPERQRFGGDELDDMEDITKRKKEKLR